MAVTDRSKPGFVRLYRSTAAAAEARGAVEHRRRLLSGLAGRVLEVGAGHGLTFAHYPPEVDEVLAVEPEPSLRALAEAAAAEAPVPVRVVAGEATPLPAGDGGFDAVVSSLVLCSVPDQAAALAEIRRVLRPGGELRFYEHVLPAGGGKRLLARVADGSGVWPRLAGGCHLGRDTVAAIAAAGFLVEDVERFDFAPQRFEPAMPHVVGRAVAPSD